MHRILVQEEQTWGDERSIPSRFAELAKPDTSSTSCVELFPLQPYAGAEDTQ